MQFKNPEILYFLFLLVIPIIVHLFQLRRFKKEYFTNLKFLKEISIQTRKSSKIKKWLLLCCRLLLLTFIIIAFTQPYFKAKESSSKNNQLFIVLDNSFSMQAKGQNGELLKRAVQELLENTPENQEFTLLTNSDSYFNTNIKSNQKELQTLNYSAYPFDINQIISKIKSNSVSVQKDVLFITDGVNLTQKELSNIDKYINPYFIIYKAEQKNNVAIDSVYLHQVLDNFYEINVKLNSFGVTNQDIPVSVFNQDKLIARTQVKLDSNSKIIKFTLPKKDIQGYISIKDNALEYDNTFYFSISNPKKINVLSIGEIVKSNFLSRIYTKDEFDYKNIEISNLDYNLIEKQDAIILNEIENISNALQTTLNAFVEKGGNLIVIPSIKSNVSNLNLFFSKFGNFQFKNLENIDNKVVKILYNHPLYKAVFEKQVTNFQYPNTKSNFSLNSNFPQVLTYENQTSFLTAINKQNGVLYVFSGALNKENSNFQNSPLIVPTFYNMAQTANKSGFDALHILNENILVIDETLSKNEILQVKNKTQSFIPIQQILNSKVKLTFNENPIVAGNYNVIKQNKNIKNISFNYLRTESNLSLYEEKLFKDLNVVNSIETVFNTLHTNRTNNVIWKWFIYLALLFILLEILIQKFIK